MENLAPVQHPDPYVRLFPDHVARRRWDNYFRFIDTQTELSDKFRSDWSSALQYFRKLLRGNFLEKTGHPITQLITGLAPWQAEQLIDLAQTLQYLTVSDPDYKHLLNKLKSDDANIEAIPFLTIAHLLQSVGFQVRFPSEDPSHPNADVVIIDSDSSAVVFGEVSKLGDSEQRKAFSDNFYVLDYILRQTLCNPLHSSLQLNYLPPEQQTSLAATLVGLRDRVIHANAAADHEDHYLRITLFPLDEEPAFNAWLQAADRRKGLNGPPLDNSEVARIAGNKLERKSKQIPPGYPGLLFIPIQPHNFLKINTADTTSAFQYRLKAFPNIIGVYLFAEILLPGTGLLSVGPHARFTETAIRGPLTRFSLFVRNEAYKPNVPPETLAKIYSLLQ